MWQVFNTAQTWNCRPSILLGVDDEYLAYCLDQAVSILGNGITNELNNVGTTDTDRRAKAREAKVQRQISKRLSQLLGLPESQAATEKQYRTPTIST